MKNLRQIVRADCGEVLRINAASLPGVAPLDKPEFDRLLEIPNTHLAIEGPAASLKGYALAFTSSAPYDGEEFQAFIDSGLKPFIYIDQVASDADHRRRGIASYLYRALEIHARQLSFSALCCEVNLEPPNPGSIAFHQDRGFRQTRVLQTQDGRTVALLRKLLT